MDSLKNIVMRTRATFLVASFLLCGALPALAVPASGTTQSGKILSGKTLPILCYHDVRDDVVGDLDEDPHAVSTRALVEQFDWLLAHGYTPISASRLLAAERGEATLPDRPILLTFDDGFASFHRRVLPLLRAYEFPAVLSVVGSWLEVPAGGTVEYGGEELPRERFLTWDQLREIADSPWVEIASHSYDLHRGVVGNRQGNTQPAANTRELEEGRLETTQEMQLRVAADLRRSRELLEERLGRAPRWMAWPYGEGAGWAFDAAREAGFEASFLLGDETAVLDGSGRWQRILVADNPSLAQWVWQIRRPAEPEPIRALALSLADLRTAGGEAALSRLLDRAVELSVGAVYLEADPRTDDPGHANRVAWQLRSRAKVHVWLRLPAATPSGELAEWASRVPVRGWVLDGPSARQPAELERAGAILRRHRTEARVALFASLSSSPSAEGSSGATEMDAILSLLATGGRTTTRPAESGIAVDHVLLRAAEGETTRIVRRLGDRLASSPASLRHRVVLQTPPRPHPDDLLALQARGFLGLAVAVPAGELDAPWLDSIRRWLSAESFPYPRPR